MRSVDSLENSDTGRDWEQEEKVTTGWHHRLDVREQEEKVTAGWQHRLSVSSSELREMVMDREAWRAAIHGVAELDMTE